MTETLVNLLRLGCMSTGQATFYNPAAEQAEQLLRSHQEAMGASRKHYLAMALLPINDIHKMMIMRMLLSHGADRAEEMDEVEWQILKYLAFSLPTARMLRFYCDMVATGNKKWDFPPINSRAKRLGRFLWRSATDFKVVKYRKKYQVILRHCHIGRDDKNNSLKLKELHDWLSGRIKRSWQVSSFNPVLRSRLLAQEGNYQELFKLPLNVALGIHKAKFPDRDVSSFQEEYAAKGKGGSSAEKLRAANPALMVDSGANIEGIAIAPMLRRMNLVDLIRYSKKADGQAGPEIQGIILDVIQEKLDNIRLELPDKTYVILDGSASMRGSREREGYPIAIAEAFGRIVLNESYRDREKKIDISIINESSDLSEAVLFTRQIANVGILHFNPCGSTGLMLSAAYAASKGYRHIIIVSDGYENVGSVNAIAAQPIVKEAGIKFYHINPVSAAESSMGTRTLGDSEDIKLLSLSGLEHMEVAAFLAQCENNPELLSDFLDRVYAIALSGNIVAAEDMATFKNNPVSLLGIAA